MELWDEFCQSFLLFLIKGADLINSNCLEEDLTDFNFYLEWALVFLYKVRGPIDLTFITFFE